MNGRKRKPLRVVARSIFACVALARPDIRERLSGLGAVPHPVSLEEFGTFVREQVGSWAKSIHEAGIEPQ